MDPQPTIYSLLTAMENEKGIKARRVLGHKISIAARKIQEEHDNTALKLRRVEEKVQPKFCNKCNRRPFQDVGNEHFEHLKLTPCFENGITRVERKEVMLLLLLARKHCRDSRLHSDLLPLEIFQHILVLSETCKVILWRDRSIRNLPRDMQFLIEQDPEDEEVKCTKNVVLKGSFRLQHLGFDSRMFPIRMDHFVKIETLKPVYTESNGLVSVQWDDAENLEWWCKFSLSSKGATLEGRIPRDTKCLNFTNYKDRDLRWTFGSETDSAFWADVFIFN